MKRPPRYIPPLGPPKPSAREQALADWRGVNLAPLEKAQKVTAKKVGDVLPDVFKKARFAQRLEEGQIAKVWNAVMDPVMAQHAQPTGLAKGTLFVKVDNSVWLEEIVRWRRKEILDRLQQSFGREMIKKISFSLG
jgi:predicted nucleic acid-binding Zn ribbon protein